MKQKIHPEYAEIEVKCSNCGTTFTIGTTATAGFGIALCSQCHPAFTGMETMVDTANRVSKFVERQKKTALLREKKAK